MFTPWDKPSPPEEQELLAESGGWVIARAGCRGRPIRYVDRVYATREDADAALDDLLSIYPDDSPWRTEIFVARV